MHGAFRRQPAWSLGFCHFQEEKAPAVAGWDLDARPRGKVKSVLESLLVLNFLFFPNQNP
jgi:hypothetical protein